MGSGGRRQEAINDDEEIALEGDPQAKPPQGRPASESAAWDYVYGLLEKHDREMIKQYSESIDNLLIFASLFSAVLSTFLFEAYDNNRLTVQLLYNEPLQLQQMSTSQIAPASFDPLSALFRVNSKLGRGQRRLAPKPHPHRLFLSHAIQLRTIRYDAFLLWKVPVIVYKSPSFYSSRGLSSCHGRSSPPFLNHSASPPGLPWS
ncbi:hypothetical protein PUNSTDRAFT_139257 [Punctularia strigosozonata HHB-11173 SS5]|uniref:DUF6535 domain-containing protein n=1 Tax=Punctularia strigosozonata (strain HHB-11173) TaxID=741275 RepID=R7S053_PUNST|nr:uncharacterized protein PUNSTDRAFT_139257 [Punctularia strigosozonata HHB-11173 SS5]EIN03725.1 hypothetical protein PUNSTDRAFT_139257 [Punctularia strigosozonata HHB-11173 SS5]